VEENPYRSPTELPAVELPSNTRAMRWAGVAVAAFAVLVYIPMTIAPLAMAIVEPQKELWIKLGASIFNGCVFVLLFWAGRWLRRRASAALTRL